MEHLQSLERTVIRHHMARSEHSCPGQSATRLGLACFFAVDDLVSGVWSDEEGNGWNRNEGEGYK